MTSANTWASSPGHSTPATPSRARAHVGALNTSSCLPTASRGHPVLDSAPLLTYLSFTCYLIMNDLPTNQVSSFLFIMIVLSKNGV